MHITLNLEAGGLQQQKRVRIWCKQLVSTVQLVDGDVMVLGNTLGLFIPTEHHLSTTARLSIVTDHSALWS